MTIDQLFAAALAESRAGRLDRAESIYRQVLLIEPGNAKAHYNLANVLRRADRIDDAIAAYEAAIKSQPDFPEALYNLGLIEQQRGRVERAIALFRQAIALRNDWPEAHANLAAALLKLGDLDGTIAAFRRMLELRPDEPVALSSLGLALCNVGRSAEGLRYRRRAAELRPDDAAAASACLFNMLVVENDPKTILAEHRRWNDRFAAALSRAIRAHDNDRSPDRRLRTGYVSADFCRHVVGWNLLPLLANHDHEKFEIYCYASVRNPDAMTQRLRSHADAWRDIANMTDEQAAETIRGDRIDILLDMGLHTSNSRLLVLARRPAPVQATFMGYPGTTGLSAIDYRLTDPYLDPSGKHDDEYAERSIRLAHSFWCYDPSADAVPGDLAPNALPALTNGFITFGCQNTLLKVSNAALALWAKVLAAVPRSRFLALAPANSARQRIADSFASAGIAADRIDFISPQPRPGYLAAYHRIDIGLDTVPYNGHTTSLDALWMGVPIVTRPGATVVSRAGFSQLSNLGLSELAAKSDEECVQIAANLAGDFARLANLRATLRGRIERSLLMNAPQFARDVEAAYREMWRTWTSHRG